MSDFDWKESHFELINNRLNSAIQNYSTAYSFPNEDDKGVIPKIIENFWEAIEYSLMGGKRIRGLLVIATVQALSGKSLVKEKDLHSEEEQEFSELVLDAAAAIECIHAFSLVHDDMPCMDDDELRRGRATCHVKFGQATALLVGDALQTLGVQILTSSSKNQSERFDLIKKLSMATGANGMAGGQAIDIDVVGKKITLSDLKLMHRMKTGALLECAVDMGLSISKNINLNTINYNELKNFSKSLGLAFQIVDDILDYNGKQATLGKKVGRDFDLQKPNFVQLMNIEKAQEHADQLLENALKSIEEAGINANPLRKLAKNLTHRIN